MTKEPKEKGMLIINLGTDLKAQLKALAEAISKRSGEVCTIARLVREAVRELLKARKGETRGGE